MLKIERTDEKTSIEVKGSIDEIARDFMELLVSLHVNLGSELDVKGMV